LVQLGLDLQYPRSRLIEARPRRARIHERPPGIPATAQLARWVPSPCSRLSRPRTTTDPPPRPGAISRQRACPSSSPTMGDGTGGSGTAPAFTISRSTGLAPSSSPCSIVTGTPQAFPMASRPAALRRLRSRRPQPSRTACAAIRPTSTRLEPASLLRGFNHWFTRVTPFRLAERALSRLVVPARLAFVGAAPTVARASGLRLPPASPGCCDSQKAESFHLRSIHGASWRTMPSGPARRLLQRPLDFEHPAA